MNWVDLATQGGGWGVAVIVAFAVWRGDLRLGREVTTVETQLAREQEKNERLKAELKETNDKIEDTVAASNQATRAELADLKKTNAEMLTALMKQQERVA
jgi:uncharacterized protein YlxW (UPF0749 family)